MKCCPSYLARKEVSVLSFFGQRCYRAHSDPSCLSPCFVTTTSDIDE
jgi:hypothetical protein